MCLPEPASIAAISTPKHAIVSEYLVLSNLANFNEVSTVKSDLTSANSIVQSSYRKCLLPFARATKRNVTVVTDRPVKTA